MLPVAFKTYSAGAPLVVLAAFLAFAGPVRADQTAAGTPIGSVVEEAPPRDIDSYTLIEILDSHDPQLLRSAIDRNPAILHAHFDNGMTALEIAAQRGDEDAVSILLGYGADIDATDYYGRTAIWYAVDATLPDNYAVVNLLCVHHANLFCYDANGDFLMDVALRLNRPRVVTLLRGYAAPTRALYPDARSREAAHRVFIAGTKERVVPKVPARTVVRVEPRNAPRRDVVVTPRIQPGRTEVRPEARPEIRPQARPEGRSDTRGANGPGGAGAAGHDERHP